MEDGVREFSSGKTVACRDEQRGLAGSPDGQSRTVIPSLPNAGAFNTVPQLC